MERADEFHAQPVCDLPLDSDPTTPVTLPFAAAGRHLAERRCVVRHYSRDLSLSCPDLSSAAILLTHVLKEAVPPEYPSVLPATRAIANLVQYNGPTQEDCEDMARHVTPLWANTVVDEKPAVTRSTVQDEEYYRMMPDVDSGGMQRRFKCTPGGISGLWEGSLMVRFVNWHRHPLSAYVSCHIQTSPLASPNADFVCRDPMQCEIVEHLCFAPNVPIPTWLERFGDNVHSTDWCIDPRQLVRTDVRTKSLLAGGAHGGDESGRFRDPGSEGY